MTKPNELLPCQVSDAIELLESATLAQIERANDAVLANCDEMGVPKYDSAFGYSCALTAIIQSDAMTTASTIPTDGEVAALVEKAKPLLECQHRANRSNPRQKGERIVGFVIGENDIGLGLSEPLFALDALIKLARIGSVAHLSTIPSAGELQDLLYRALPYVMGLQCASSDRLVAEINTALAALSTQTISGKGMREAWQPIETAPKDGTVFLAWVHTRARGRVVTVEWCDGQWIETCDLAGWVNGYGPTHWQPLPDPPALVDQGERG